MSRTAVARENFGFGGVRVLHFFKTYWPDTFGGIERSIHAIATGTATHGIQTDVLSLSKKPKENTLKFDGHHAWKAKLDFEIASTGFSHEAIYKFRTLAEQADVIHYHFPWPFMDLVDLLTTIKKPTVVTYHSDIVKQRLLLKMYAPLMRRFLRTKSIIVATSPNYLKSSSVLQACDQSRLRVIPLGLDDLNPSEFQNKSSSDWSKILPKNFFLFVGVLRYYKGIQYLIDAAKISKLPVVIVGDGPLYAQISKSLNCDEDQNIILTGALSDMDKLELLKLCRAFVFPSHLRSEAFGLSLVEAARAGKPMISCEIQTGSSYVNKDRVTGIVVEPQNAFALAHAMKELAVDDTLCQQMGAQARYRYEAKFTSSLMAARYAAIYKEIF
jgi:rhamnosyl/mannosyltransferase